MPRLGGYSRCCNRPLRRLLLMLTFNCFEHFATMNRYSFVSFDAKASFVAPQLDERKSHDAIRDFRQVNFAQVERDLFVFFATEN